MHAFTLAHDNLLCSWKRALSISRVRAVHREAKGPVGQGFPARAGRRYRGLPTVGSERAHGVHRSPSLRAGPSATPQSRELAVGRFLQ